MTLSTVHVRSPGAHRGSLSELVMAWARDSATGEARYILELDETQRGAKCGCECPSCGAALTGVNVAKEEFEVRPHFRHPPGAQRHDCLVLASRLALLRQFEEGGWLELPRRRVSATVEGLSGEAYEAWVEQPPEKLHISQVSYRDRTRAVITFDDGRQLIVYLTGVSGTGIEAADGSTTLAPSIILEVNDPSLAALEPTELRSRLRLLPDVVCWRSHWNESDLLEQAGQQARARARFELDALPEGLELPADLPPELKRESVLHFEVKRILSEERRINVPEVQAEASSLGLGGATIRRTWSEPEQVLKLDYIDLEHRFGRIVPDVTCKAWPEHGGRVFWPLFIEVAVTNVVDSQRLVKIRQQSHAALEIDFSRTGGWVNRDQLKRIVVEDVGLKRWLYNPLLEEAQARLEAEVTEEVQGQAAAQEAHRSIFADRKRAALAAPLEDLAREFVEAAVALYDAFADTDSESRQTEAQQRAELAAKERMADVVDKLALRGFPEAGNAELLGDKGILSRILSCKMHRPVGYRVANVVSVLNAMWQTQGWRRSYHSLTFIALAVYESPLTAEQRKTVDGWRAKVRLSIQSNEPTYLRDPGYDRLLSLLFPEMAPALAKQGGKRQGDGEQSFEQASRRAHFLENQPRADQAKGPLLDTPPGQWWLKGRDLKAWQAGQEPWVAAQFDARRPTV